jgi:hypothetical protein
MKCRIPDLQAAVTPTFRGDIFKPLVVLAVLLAKWKPSFQVCTDKRASIQDFVSSLADFSLPN